MKYNPDELVHGIIVDLVNDVPLEERKFRLLFHYICEVMRGKRSLTPYANDVFQRVMSAYDLHEDMLRNKPNRFDWATVWAAVSTLEQYTRSMRQDERDTEHIAIVKRYFDIFQIIEAYPWRNQKTLAEKLGKRSITRQLNKICETDDLVCVIKTPDNVIYSLTETGSRILNDVKNQIKEKRNC